ncbi:MAG: thiamine pyrophosphate-dependent enzyme, partial [Polyangiaceae bacterium]
QQSPQAVDEKWRQFFDGLNGDDAASANAASTHGEGSNGGNGSYVNGTRLNGEGGIAAATNGASRKEALLAAAAIQGRVYQLLNAYRVRGHLFAHLDPLALPSGMSLEGPPPELNLSNFGLSVSDLDTTFPTVGIAGLPERATLRSIIAHLSETYCRSIGVEFTQIEEPDAREWIQQRMESTRNRAELGRDQVLRILSKLTDAETFESFIAKNYIGAKRFSVEGAESMIALLDLLIDEAGAQGVAEIVLGMAHRGRLNVLANIMGKNVREIFAAFDDKNPERFLGGGDVKYHLGYSSDRETPSGSKVHLSLAFNPSHLEFVNPVVEGRVRAKQDRKKRTNVMPLLIHGDAAFMGQGVVPETLNMAGLEGYSTGGTVHVVVNNQIGFTTMPRDSRSTRYSTDITRMRRCPVFHVNGEDPEAVIQVTRLAVEYRERFQKDVVIDMFCYRKLGHNEGDEPRFTQPVMYGIIDKKPTVRQAYVARLVDAGEISKAEADHIAERSKANLDVALEEARKGDWLKKPNAMEGLWAPYYGGPDARVPEVPTAVPKEKLVKLLVELEQVPQGFTPNAKVHAMIKRRREHATAPTSVLQWETGEALAYASLVSEGSRIRLSGQDVRRGTFSHRHAVLFDSKNNAPHCALDELAKEHDTRFEVFDSPLSET